MNREIKFRAYCEKHNRWEVYTLGDLICGNATSENEEGGVFANWCQYTGFQDKDGKDIFENDIVSFMEDGDISVGIPPLNIKGIIEYLEGSYVVSQENTNNKYIDLMSYTINPSFKIIGNKFDKEED